MTTAEEMERAIGSETYGFNAIRGIQAGRDFYVAMCPLKIIPKLFIFNEYDLPPKLRAQRTLRDTRIPVLKNYILNNPDNYVFSSLTASVDGAMNFLPAEHLGPDGKLGRLYINMDSRLLINDGQHRRKAIEEALKEKPELGHETISVVFFHDLKLKNSQQMFSDLNKNAVKSSKSLNILYDHRNAFSQFVVDLVDEIDIFKDRVELEKTTLSNRTTKFFTLNGVTDATMRFLGGKKIKKITLEQKKIVKEFWRCVEKNIPEWQLLINNKVSPVAIRKEFIHGNTNLLNSLGIMGNVLLKTYPDKWKEKLANIKKVDWSRANPKWEGRLIQGGRLVKTTIGVELGANTLLKTCGVQLSKTRLNFEEKQ